MCGQHPGVGDTRVPHCFPRAPSPSSPPSTCPRFSSSTTAGPGGRRRSGHVRSTTACFLRSWRSWPRSRRSVAPWCGCAPTIACCRGRGGCVCVRVGCGALIIPLRLVGAKDPAGARRRCWAEDPAQVASANCDQREHPRPPPPTAPCSPTNRVSWLLAETSSRPRPGADGRPARPCCGLVGLACAPVAPGAPESGHALTPPPPPPPPPLAGPLCRAS